MNYTEHPCENHFILDGYVDMVYWNVVLISHTVYEHAACVGKWLEMTLFNKKLIRRWDSECELFYDDTFNHCLRSVPEDTEFGEITQNKGHYAVQGPSN